MGNGNSVVVNDIGANVRLLKRGNSQEKEAALARLCAWDEDAIHAARGNGMLSDDAYAKLALRKMLPPGTVVWTILRHVSRSGMLREIAVAVPTVRSGEPELWHLTNIVADAIGEKVGKHEGVRVGGAGMDMGFDLVYRLSSALYPNGYRCTGERRCQGAEHANEQAPYGDPMLMHRNGGYALRQRWL